MVEGFQVKEFSGVKLALVNGSKVVGGGIARKQSRCLPTILANWEGSEEGVGVGRPVSAGLGQTFGVLRPG